MRRRSRRRRVEEEEEACSGGFPQSPRSRWPRYRSASGGPCPKRPGGSRSRSPRSPSSWATARCRRPACSGGRSSSPPSRAHHHQMGLPIEAARILQEVARPGRCLPGPAATYADRKARNSPAETAAPHQAAWQAARGHRMSTTSEAHRTRSAPTYSKAKGRPEAQGQRPPWGARGAFEQKAADVQIVKRILHNN